MIELIANIQKEIDNNYIYTYDLINNVSYKIGTTARDAITYLLYHKFDQLISTYQIDYHYRATKLDSLQKDGIDYHTKTYFNDAFTDAGSKKYVEVCGDIDKDENMYAYKISDLMELKFINQLQIEFKDHDLIEKINIDSRKYNALELLDLIGVNAGSLPIIVLEDLEAYEVEQIVIEINSFLCQQCNITEDLYLPSNLELEYIFAKVIKNLDEQAIADLYIELNDFLNVQYGLMLDFRKTENINDLFEYNSLSVFSNKIKDIIFKEVSPLSDDSQKVMQTESKTDKEHIVELESLLAQAKAQLNEQQQAPQRSRSQTDETNTDKKLVAMLAILLAKQSNTFRIGDRPNATQINEQVLNLTMQIVDELGMNENDTLGLKANTDKISKAVQAYADMFKLSKD